MSDVTIFLNSLWTTYKRNIIPLMEPWWGKGFKGNSKFQCWLHLEEKASETYILEGNADFKVTKWHYEVCYFQMFILTLTFQSLNIVFNMFCSHSHGLFMGLGYLLKMLASHAILPYNLGYNRIVFCIKDSFKAIFLKSQKINSLPPPFSKESMNN